MTTGIRPSESIARTQCSYGDKLEQARSHDFFKVVRGARRALREGNVDPNATVGVRGLRAIYRQTNWSWNVDKEWKLKHQRKDNELCRLFRMLMEHANTGFLCDRHVECIIMQVAIDAQVPFMVYKTMCSSLHFRTQLIKYVRELSLYNHLINGGVNLSFTWHCIK